MVRQCILPLCVLALLLAADGSPGAPADPPREQVSTLGTVHVGEYQGEVCFQFPEDDGAHYRFDVVVSKANDSPPIKLPAEAWLLARGGRTVAQAKDFKSGHKDGPWIEVRTGGTSASTSFWFARDVERNDLVAVVVSIDGELTMLKIPPMETDGKKNP